MSDVLAAHRIPAELLDQIAEDAFDYPYDLAAEKPAMAAFSSVNRRWAQICRPALWHGVYIFSDAKVRSLCTLLDTPPPSSLASARSLVQTISYIINMNTVQAPWHHRAHRALAAKFCPHAPKVQLYIVGDADNAPSRIRSLFPNLPRTLPNLHLPVRSLYVGNVHFESRAVLLRLLVSIPQLENIGQESISWATDAPPPNSSVLSSHMRRVLVESPDHESGGRLGVEDMSWWLPAMIGHRPCPTQRDIQAIRDSLSLRDSDHAAMTAMNQCLISKLALQSVEIERHDHFAATGMPYVSFKFWDVTHAVFSSLCSLRIDVHYAASRHSRATNPGPQDSPTPASIYCIKMAFLRSELSSHWSLDDWAQFREHLCCLSELETFDFKFNQEAGLKEFVDKFGSAFDVENLPQRLWFWNQESNEWASLKDLIEEGNERRK